MSLLIGTTKIKSVSVGATRVKTIKVGNVIVWSDTPDFLYSWGNQNTDYTGGWANCYPYGLYGSSWWNTTYVSSPGWYNDYVDFPMAGYPTVKTIITNNKIDFSNIKSLTFNGAGITNYQLNWVMALTDGNGGTIYRWVTASSNPTPGDHYASGRDGTFTLDTSDFNGTANVAFGAYQSDAGGDSDIILRSIIVNQ